MDDHSILLTGATVIDGVASAPIVGSSIWIEGSRIKAIIQGAERPPGVPVHDATGRFVIPGLLNANVHLLCDVRLENLVRLSGRFEDAIEEAAQIALKNGLTTVFDTWGPRAALVAVRDRINSREAVGSRIFCAGNIVGFDGPYSPDFHGVVTDLTSADMVEQINSMWVENVGRHLMWLPPDRVAQEVRAYIGRGVDFLKYASNEHFGVSHGAFIAFSPDVQRAIIAEARQAGLTVQAHTMTVEGLKIAAEAGCDLIQHANMTGPEPIPPATVDLLARNGVRVVVFPFLKSRLEWLNGNGSYRTPAEWNASDENVRRLISGGVEIVLGTDGALFAADAQSDPTFSEVMSAQGSGGADNLFDLGTGHFAWLRAMEEKGFPPMQLLKAATANVAAAYGKADELGTIQAGRRADLLVLDRDPLASAANYQSIELVMKDGVFVDHGLLPLTPLLTGAAHPAPAELKHFVPFLPKRGGGFPLCPCGISRWKQ